MKKLTPLRKRGGNLYSNRVQARVLSMFAYFGVKLFLLTMYTRIYSNRVQARVLSMFSYFGVKLYLPCVYTRMY